ncbi:MAG: hypothetical protein Fur0016_00790 [Anaerolineales bacterium]
MPISAKLERTKIAEQTWIFSLVVSGDSEQTFYLARIKNGGMTLVNYEINKNGDGHDVLSAFLYVNIMGHDLDQWIHFDLETGQQLLNYNNPRQASGQNPEHDPMFYKNDKRQIAKKLRQSLEKWGRKQDIEE